MCANFRIDGKAPDIDCISWKGWCLTCKLYSFAVKKSVRLKSHEVVGTYEAIMDHFSSVSGTAKVDMVAHSLAQEKLTSQNPSLTKACNKKAMAIYKY